MFARYVARLVAGVAATYVSYLLLRPLFPSEPMALALFLGLYIYVPSPPRSRLVALPFIAIVAYTAAAPIPPVAAAAVFIASWSIWLWLAVRERWTR